MGQNQGSILKFIILGALLSVVLQTMATLVLLAAQNSGREVAAAGIGSNIVTSSLGLAVIARHATRSQTVLVALVYFPTMFGLMFLEAVYLDARIYGNTF